MLNYKMSKQRHTLNRGSSVCNRFSRRKRSEEIDEEEENEEMHASAVYKNRLKGSIAIAVITHSYSCPCSCVCKPGDDKK